MDETPHVFVWGGLLFRSCINRLIYQQLNMSEYEVARCLLMKLMSKSRLTNWYGPNGQSVSHLKGSNHRNIHANWFARFCPYGLSCQVVQQLKNCRRGGWGMARVCQIYIFHSSNWCSKHLKFIEQVAFWLFFACKDKVYESCMSCTWKYLPGIRGTG